jgi:hypothetical protein
MKTRMGKTTFSFQLDKLVAGWWTFHTSGKLEHPNKLNSSWFNQVNGQWMVDEWATDMTTELRVALLDAVRSSQLTQSK